MHSSLLLAGESLVAFLFTLPVSSSLHRLGIENDTGRSAYASSCRVATPTLNDSRGEKSCSNYLGASLIAPVMFPTLEKEPSKRGGSGPKYRISNFPHVSSSFFPVPITLRRRDRPERRKKPIWSCKQDTAGAAAGPTGSILARLLARSLCVGNRKAFLAKIDESMGDCDLVMLHSR